MGIQQIAVLAPDAAADLHSLRISGAVGGKAALHGLHERLRRHVDALFLQFCHQSGHQIEIAAGREEEIPLQITGHKDVHGRRNGLEELPASVITAGADEISEHIVGIGRADQLRHRKSHPAGKLAGEDVAEVAGGHHKADLVAQRNPAGQHKVDIRLEIVRHLRCEPSKVDGIGAGQPDAGLLRPAIAPVVGKDVLHAGLSIVKIPADGAHAHIAALLGDHLRLLHVADASVGIEYNDSRAGHIPEALQRGLAGIAAGGGQNHDVVGHAQLFAGCRDQPRQRRQRHILECRRRPAEQLQHIGVANLFHRGQLVGFEPVFISGGNQRAHLLGRKVRQNPADHRRGDLHG